MTLRTENAILSEKLAQAKLELDDQRRREVTLTNERVVGMEAEMRAMREEARRKEQ